MATPQASDLIFDAKKTLEALKLSNDIISINRTFLVDIETIRSVAKNADEIDVRSVELLEDFRHRLLSLGTQCDAIKDAASNLESSGKSMNKTLREIVATHEKTSKKVKDCLDKLHEVLDSANEFGKEYQSFRTCLEEVIKSAENLRSNLEDEHKKAQLEVSSRKNKGYGATAGMAVAASVSVALGIAGFFTLGATWAPAAALASGVAAGTGLGIGSVTKGIKTTLDVQELDRKADGLLKIIDSLSANLRQLDRVYESSTEKIQFSDDMINAISDMIDMYQERHRVLEKEERLEAQYQAFKVQSSNMRNLEEKFRESEARQNELLRSNQELQAQLSARRDAS